MIQHTLGYNSTKVCVLWYDMDTLVKRAQNLVFLWYDIVHLCTYSTKFV